MAYKKVTGTRTADIELDGSVYTVNFGCSYNYYAVRNDSTGTIYVSTTDKSCTPNNDGVISIPSGGGYVHNNGFGGSTEIYISGSGRALVIAQDDGRCPFFKSRKGGDSGGSIVTSTTIDSTSTNVTVPTSKAVYDFAKGYTDKEIADLINGAPETLDTLGEIATAMQDNHNVVEALDLAIGQKANKAELTALETAVNNELEAKADKDNIPVATTEKVGGIKPDDITVSVDENGVLSAQKAIDSIEIGGRNYLINSDFRNGLPNAQSTNINVNIEHVSPNKNALRLAIADPNGTSWYKIPIAFEFPGTYTVSFKVKSSAPGISPSNFACLENTEVSGDIEYFYRETKVFDGEWETISAKKNISKEFVGTIFNITIRPAKALENYLLYTDFQVEKGNKAKDWSPAPEDITNAQKSNAKLTIQIAHPNNYLIYDNMDNPSTMVAIPKFYLDDVIDGAEHIVHPAFLVNGVEQNAIYISKYQNIVENNRAYSLPMKDPAVNVNFEQAWTYCKNKGAGWHLMTNAEWAAIALWCKKNGTIPKGNNNFGKDISETDLPQKALAASVGSDGKINRVLTGSGRETWYHDGTYAGIADLNGNIYEWLGDMRLIYGELQIIPNIGECDISANSADWKAINANATSYDDLFITPNGSGTTANSVKLDRTADIWTWTNTITNRSDSPFGKRFYLTSFSNLSDFTKTYLQALALLPAGDTATDTYNGDYLYGNNGRDEVIIRRGNCFNENDNSGVFMIDSLARRSIANDKTGMRVSYYNMSAQPLAVTLGLSDVMAIDDTENAEMTNAVEIAETESGHEE